MKKIITLVACVALAATTLMAQGLYAKSIEVFPLQRGEQFTHSTYQFPATIASVKTEGPARLAWAFDTACFVESYVIANSDEKLVEPDWEGDKLTLQCKNRTIYILHTNRQDLDFEMGNNSEAVRFSQIQKLNDFGKAMEMAASAALIANMSLPLHSIYNLAFFDLEATIDGTTSSTSNLGHSDLMAKNLERTDALLQGEEGYTIRTTMSMRQPESDKSPEYNPSDRSNFDFHWGFNNWGSTPYNGLMGMSDAGYDLHTSFSSYQLSENYSIILRRHFACGIGLGYESDVYKFNSPYVDYNNGAFTAKDSTTANGYFSSRFVTRYVQLPIHLTYYAKANHKGFQTSLSIIPALGFTGNHTGLKHQVHQRGRDPQDQRNLSDDLNPYKLDVRLDLSMKGGLGIFVQASTLPVFVQGAKIYPIKIGFKI